MPEGHTIHRIAKDHTPLLAGQQVRVSSPQGRFEADAALVDGTTLERIEAYGKHLFYWYSNGRVGHVHLGLFGKFRVYKGDLTHEPVGFPARTSAPLVEAKESGRGTVRDCGLSSHGSFAKWDPDGCSWRTSELWLDEDWSPRHSRRGPFEAGRGRRPRGVRGAVTAAFTPRPL